MSTAALSCIGSRLSLAKERSLAERMLFPWGRTFLSANTDKPMLKCGTVQDMRLCFGGKQECPPHERTFDDSERLLRHGCESAFELLSVDISEQETLVTAFLTA